MEGIFFIMMSGGDFFPPKVLLCARTLTDKLLHPSPSTSHDTWTRPSVLSAFHRLNTGTERLKREGGLEGDRRAKWTANLHYSCQDHNRSGKKKNTAVVVSSDQLPVCRTCFIPFPPQTPYSNTNKNVEHVINISLFLFFKNLTFLLDW